MAIKPETVKRFTIEGNSRKDEKDKSDHIERLESYINKIKFRVEQLGRMVDALCLHRSYNVNPKDTSIESIIDYIAFTLRVDREKITNRVRDHGDIDRARRLGMWLAKQVGNHTLGQIAKAFERKDHATVAHAIKEVEKSDKMIANRIANDFMERKQHAEAETTTGRCGANSEVEGLAKTVPRTVSATDGERSN